MNNIELDGARRLKSAPSHTRTSMALVLLGAVALGGCASMNNTEKGATAGAAAGGVLGGVIGSNNGSTAKGAILGAVIGGAAGAVIGRRMDKQAEELDAELEGASVERVGEGIQVTFDSGILFDFDSHTLRSASRDNLSELARTLQDYPGSDVIVIGHTDSSGNENYNQKLSTERAEAARSFLMNQGVASDRVEAKGLGESEPVESNDSEAGRQANRRVEVAIFASEELREEMQKKHGTAGAPLEAPAAPGSAGNPGGAL